MKNVNIDFNTIKTFFGKQAKNLTWTFFVIFLILVVFEIFEVKNSVDIALNVNQAPPLVTAEKGVRINFSQYETVVQRIEAAPNFVPDAPITQDPFSVPAPPGT
jgi:hypothetical protein